jgi:predicted GTPase
MMIKTTLPIVNGVAPIYLVSSSIVFLGKTGVGKTSTINALFDLNSPTDNAWACTASLKTKMIRTQNGMPIRGVSITDTPGFGESIRADGERHLQLSNIVSRADRIVWLFQADSRVYRPDQVAMRMLSEYIHPSAKLFIGLNRIDQVGPNNWDAAQNCLSEEQERNVNEIIEDIYKKMGTVIGIPKDHILPYSAKYGTGLQALKRKIIGDFRV